MRTVPGGLASLLDTGSSSLCKIVDIERKDGTTISFTEGDVTIGPYVRMPGLVLGSIPYGLDGFSSGVDLQFGSDEDTTLITQKEIRDGVYDAATVTITEVDQTLGGDGVIIFWGKVGDITRAIEGKIKLQAKGILSLSHQVLVEHYTPMCLWFFCDSRCGLDPDDYTWYGTISAITDNYTLAISWTGGTPPDDVLKDGVMTVTSGVREGHRVEVRSNAGSEMKTFLAHPRELVAGPTVMVLQGCQKRFVDCQAYNNHLRFGGQPRAGSPEEATSITYVGWS